MSAASRSASSITIAVRDGDRRMPRYLKSENCLRFHRATFSCSHAANAFRSSWRWAINQLSAADSNRGTSHHEKASHHTTSGWGFDVSMPRHTVNSFLLPPLQSARCFSAVSTPFAASNSMTNIAKRRTAARSSVSGGVLPQRR